MDRKAYIRPATKVVELRQTGMLMMSHQDLSVSRSDYRHSRTDGSEGTDDEEWE